MTATVATPAVGSPEWWTLRARLTTDEAAANAWSENGQRVRHEAVVNQLDLQHGEALLDWGCGTGAFADCLPGWVNYLGVDPCVAMTQRARLARPHRTYTSMPTIDDLAPADHIVAIGPFNLAHHWSTGQTWSTLNRLWDLTRRTLVVSLLRDVDNPDHLSYHPDDAAEFATKRTKLWSVDASYLPNDLLFVMRRDPS